MTTPQYRKNRYFYAPILPTSQWKGPRWSANPINNLTMVHLQKKWLLQYFMLMMPTFRGDGCALSLAKFHLITPMMINISINEVKRLVRLIIECKQWHGIIFTRVHPVPHRYRQKSQSDSCNFFGSLTRWAHRQICWSQILQWPILAIDDGWSIIYDQLIGVESIYGIGLGVE